MKITRVEPIGIISGHRGHKISIVKRPNQPRMMVYVDGFGWFVRGSHKQGYEFSDMASNAKMFRSVSSIVNTDVYKNFSVKIMKAEVSWTTEINVGGGNAD